MFSPLFSIAPKLKSRTATIMNRSRSYFPAEGLLVPAHGALQGVHGVGGARRHARIDEDAQGDLAAAHGDEGVFQHVQLAGHQGEQVAGLGKGIVPDRVVAPARQLAGLHQIAVGEQVAKRGAASMRTVKRASTSGRSANQVILRKPSASHWVQNRPPDM